MKTKTLSVMLLLACACQFNPPSHYRMATKKVYETSSLGFSQAVRTAPGDMVFLSGQVGWDQHKQLVGISLEDQGRQAMENIRLLLAAQGGNMCNITHLRFYVANYQPAQSAVIGQLLKGFFNPDCQPTSTLLGVASLARLELKIEIEAIAVL